MGRLIPLWDELRSYLGIVALLAIGLPAVVLVLTLLADNGRRLPEPMPDGGVEGSEVAHRQGRPGIDAHSGNGTGSVRPLARRGETGSPDGSSEADGAGPTRRPARGQEDADREQDPPNAAADAPATSTATAAAAPPTAPAEPTSTGPTTPPVATATAPATAPATTSAPAPTATATASPGAASASESSPPTIAAPVPTPVDVPVEGIHGVVSAEHLNYPFE